MLSILIWLPAAAALIGAITGGERAGGGCSRCSARSARSAIAIALIAGYTAAPASCTHVTDVSGSARSGSTTRSASTA